MTARDSAAGRAVVPVLALILARALVLVPALALAIAGCREVGKPPVRERGHDPWVFRLVLDDRPRMLVAALAPQLWVAYDAQQATLHRVWSGGVNLDGAVYNAHHGPQPMSLGQPLLSGAIEEPWHFVRPGEDLTPRVRYGGHRFSGGQVYLLYSLALEGQPPIEIQERPEARTMSDGSLGLERTFTMKGAPAGLRVELEFTFTALDSQEGVRILDHGGGRQLARLALESNAERRLLMRFPEPLAAVDPARAKLSPPEQLIASSDCAACHNPTERTIGPSYKQIAERYRTSEHTVAGLARKIREGGGGEWGDAVMVAHQGMTADDAATIARYILTTFDPDDAHGEQATHPLGPGAEEPDEDEDTTGHPAGAGAPGDRRPLEGVHPSFRLSTIRPQSFKPMVGGLDFLPDGRLLVSTWDARGSVHVLDNLSAADPEQIRVKEIASGLLEPLGLKVVDGVPYVLQKHELTKLVDSDGDGIVDEYRTVTDAWGVNSNFHLFAFGLEYRDGHFYATLATEILPGGASAQPQIPDRGKVMRIEKATGAIEYIAKGLRTPNGIGPGIDGELYIADNQGDWLPANKIVRLEGGAFYGSHAVDPAGTRDTPVTPPLVWLPQDEVANSPSQPLRFDFGPYRNQMLYGDVTHGGLNRIVAQKVEGRHQGCVIPFTQGLEAGINRAIVGPDGAIYVGGIGNPGNWGQEGKLWYGLQKLTYTGAPTFEMLDVQLRSDGMELAFTEPIRAGDGEAPADYEIRQWRYVPTAEYGGPKVDERTLQVRSAHVSPDRRRVFLEVQGIRAGHVLYVRLANPMIAESNRELWATETWCTVNALPKDLPGERFGSGASPAPNTLTEAQRAAGWKLLFDGRGTRGWHAFRGKGVGSGWTASQGTLTLAPGGAGGDIVTDEAFGDFELELEWQIARGGNSGVFYRVSETPEEIWQWAPEMQVLDDEKHEDGRDRLHRAGSAYDLIEPRFDVTRPPGQYNRARILVRGTRVEHWLNGHKLVEYDTSTPEWRRLLARSKFAGFTEFGASRKGRIGLQDHGDAVRFRNIRIRQL